MRWQLISNKADITEFYFDCQHIFSSSYMKGMNQYFKVDHSVKIISNKNSKF
jgi:hypothetical protein